MECAYVIDVSEKDVYYVLDPKIIFERNGKYLTIKTSGMSELTIQNENADLYTMPFPCNTFSLPLHNGTYVVLVKFTVKRRHSR